MGERAVALQMLFDRCAQAHGVPEVRSMPFNTEDRGARAAGAREYSMCYDKRRPEMRAFCGPDWCSVHWPSVNIFSFEAERDAVLGASGEPPELPDKVGWCGNIYSPLADVIESVTRPMLRQIAEEHPQDLEVVHVPPHCIRPGGAGYMTLTQLVRRYGILIDIGGNGYSGRLKYLMFSRRPLLIVDRNYIEWFHDALVPFEHYVPVKEDLSDLLVRIAWVKANPERSLQIAENALRFATETFSDRSLLAGVLDVHRRLIT